MVSSPRIGVFVLESLTSGMYGSPLECLREYVQNAADSIQAANRLGVLAKGEGRIVISLDPATRSIRIRDNGLGIPAEQVNSRLQTVGMSHKTLGIDAGFRGIGRLAGMAYCSRLLFRTTATGESALTALSYDCDGLRLAMTPESSDAEEFGNALSANTLVLEEEATPDAHFFEATLDGLTQGASMLLDWLTVEKYVSQVGPVGFDADSFPLADKINEWAASHALKVPEVDIVLDAPGVRRRILKQYKGEYRTKLGEGYALDIKDVAFYPESPTPASPFWAWYSQSDLLGQINHVTAGLRFRQNNIGIGGTNLAHELFASSVVSNGRFNSYYIGEIHINSARVLPNSQRDGFEDMGEWPAVRSQLLQFVNILSDAVRATSNVRNRPLAKVASAVKKTLEETTALLGTGFILPREKTSILAKLDKLDRLVEQVLATRKQQADSEALLELQEEISRTRNELLEVSGRQAIQPWLTEKDRRFLSGILDNLCRSLDEATFTRVRNLIIDGIRATECD